MAWYDSLARFAGVQRRRPEREAAPQYVWRPSSLEPAIPGNESHLPRFAATAGDQVDMGGAFAEVRAKLRQAYTPAQPVTNRRMYVGRSRVLASVIQAIEDQRMHTVLYGERGIGKTSTLHVLAQIARDARYLVIYITGSAGSSFDETVRAICAGIPLMFHADFGPTSPEAERRETFDALLGPEAVSTRVAGDLLSKVTGTRVLAIIDEFDRPESTDFRRSIGELIKSLSDRAARVQIVIGGVAGNLSELIANIPSIQRNILGLPLPKMSTAEIHDLIRNGETTSGLTFQTSAIDAITRKALGFPYLATLLCHRAALVALDHARLSVGAEEVAQAVSEIVEEFRGRIPRRVVLQVEDAIARGMLPTLAALGGASQTAGGWFSLQDAIALHPDSSSPVEVRKAIDRVLDATHLLEMQDEENTRIFHFMEETVPPYLWLLGGGVPLERISAPVSAVQPAAA